MSYLKHDEEISFVLIAITLLLYLSACVKSTQFNTHLLLYIYIHLHMLGPKAGEDMRIIILYHLHHDDVHFVPVGMPGGCIHCIIMLYLPRLTGQHGNYAM